MTRLPGDGRPSGQTEAIRDPRSQHSGPRWPSPPPLSPRCAARRPAPVPPPRLVARDGALGRRPSPPGPSASPAGPTGWPRVVGVSGGRRPRRRPARPTPRPAARAHLERYGALVGVGDRGTRLVGGTVVADRDRRRRRAVHRAARDGLPVIGGAVAVDLRPDRQLGVASPPRCRARPCPPRRTRVRRRGARRWPSPAKRLGADVRVTRRPTRSDGSTTRRCSACRRTSDPTTHARGVWWVEVHAGPAFHRLVLVDDRTGARRPGPRPGRAGRPGGLRQPQLHDPARPAVHDGLRPHRARSGQHRERTSTTPSTSPASSRRSTARSAAST